jgi:hypothetical protein
MLRRRADAELQGGYVATTPIGNPITPTSTNASKNVSDEDLSTTSHDQNSASHPQQTASPTNAKRQASWGAVLAAWVLLAGSVAGNLYLLWSYLDVRARFQSMNRQNVRAPRNRLSAA